MKKVLTFILSISIAVSAFAQGNSIPKSSKIVEELPEILPDSVKYRYPLINGVSITANIFDPIMALFAMDHANYEVTGTLDLHHRFFPQFSAGLGYSNEQNDNQLGFKVKASPFFKVGVLYNLKYNSTQPKYFYYFLLRYGWSTCTAEIENIKFTDGYWPDYVPGQTYEQSYNNHWFELGGGVKVHMGGPISLGWELSIRPLLSSGDNKYGSPYFVPGRGTHWLNFAFNLTYDIF